MLPSVLAERRWVPFLVLVATGVVQSLCFLALVYWAKAYIEGGLVELSGLSVFLVLSAILLLSGGRFLERYQAELIAQRYVRHLRDQIYQHTLRLPLKDVDLANKGGTLLRLTGDMTAIRNWIVQGMAPLIVIGLWLGFAVSGLFVIHPALAFCLIFPIAVGVVINYFLGKRLFQHTERVRQRRGLLIRNVTEKLRELRLIRAFNQDAREMRRFGRQTGRLYESQVVKARTSALLRGINEAVVLITVLLLMLVGFGLVQRGELTIESVAIVMTASLYLMAQLRRLSRLYEFWTLRQVAKSKISAFLGRSIISNDGRKRLPKKEFQIQLDAVSSQGRFTACTAVIGASSRILLRGASGSGKSSLLMALTGLLPITAGGFRISGVKLARFHPQMLSQQVALVSGRLPLLKGSLRKNLFYGARKCNTQYVDQVLALTGLNELIEELEAGMDSRVSESGANLSEGLRYRIMLARALLRRPKLLLLDNEAAMFNPDVKAMLYRLMSEFEGAILVNANNIEMPQCFDQYWSLDQHRLCVMSTDHDQAHKVLRMANHVENL